VPFAATAANVAPAVVVEDRGLLGEDVTLQTQHLLEAGKLELGLTSVQMQKEPII
jgi:hypothetical protein